MSDGGSQLPEGGIFLPWCFAFPVSAPGHVEGKAHADDAALLSSTRPYLWTDYAEAAYEYRPDASRPTRAVRSLHLVGMDEQAAQDLLADKGLNGTPEPGVPWELCDPRWAMRP
jgi:hypothetical protein